MDDATGRIVWERPSWRIVGMNRAARRLLQISRPLGLRWEAAAGRYGLPPSPPPPELPRSAHRILRLPDGSERAFLLHVRSAGERAESVLEPADRSLGLADQLGAAIAAVDDRGLVVHVNAAAADDCGLPPSRLRGRGAGALAAVLAARAADPAPILAAVRTHPPADGLPVGEREGARRHVHFAASVWRFCGAPCGALWSWVDVTDSVERNRDTAAAWHSAAATFQHELRNPLQTMEAVVQLLRPVLPEEGQKFGAMLEQQIQTMSEYLLDQMRPPAPTSFIPDRLSDVVQAEVERAGLRIATRQLRFCHFPPVDEPAVLLHRRSLGRVFANLFRNSAQARVDARVEVRYEVGADRIACVVTDDGPGFAGGADGEVLQPSRYRPERLGLAIVTATVEAHGGCVTAGNAPGGGASVRIVLPARAAGQGADVPAEAAALPAV